MEAINHHTLMNIFLSLPPSSSRSRRKKEVRKLMKDTIEVYFDKHQLKAKEAAKQRNTTGDNDEN